MSITEKKREANRIAQAKYRNTEKGKQYLSNYRESHREEYLAYQREYSKKRYDTMKNEKSNNTNS